MGLQGMHDGHPDAQGRHSERNAPRYPATIGALSRKGVVEAMRRNRVVRAIFERDENGYWSVVAQLGRRRSAISDGQTLPKARKRIREAVALLLDAPSTSFDVEEVIRLPAPAERALLRFTATAREALRKEEQLARARESVAKALVKAGISRRDAGEILGVSGMRVQQLVGK